MSLGIRCLALLFTCAFYSVYAVTDDDPVFTVEQILSAPFPSSLVSSPEGNRLAWVLNDAGVRNIWVAEGDAFEARKLTDFDQDDGQTLDIIGFGHDGRWLVFRRGGPFNPRSNPEGAPGAKIYRISWDGGSSRELAEAGGGILSPVDSELAFTKNRALWLVRFDDESEPRQIVSPRGSIRAPEWSPDGKKIALTAARGSMDVSYGFIAIYDIETKNMSFVDPSVYGDGNPVWSPDGRRIAFLRRLREDQKFVLTARVYPLPDPWEIRVFDLETGKAETLWRSPENDTSFAAELDWLTPDKILFASEQTGWRHLYALDHSDGTVRQLTSGPFEVETMTVDPSRGRVHYVTNAGDIDRRHIWSVDTKNEPRQLTEGKGIEWSPMLTGDGQWLAFFASTARMPARPFVRKLGGGPARALAPETFPSDFPVSLAVPEQVLFKSSDGWDIHGQLFLPPSRSTGKRPAVMYFHGGPVRQMLLGFHYRGYYHNAYAMNQYLASRGFVVLSINYRLGIGYGRGFRDVPDGGPRGASEYRDLLAGAAYLRGHERVNASRIGLWGGSYGGLMTALGLARNSDLFAAGVDFHGVHDWNKWQAHVERRENDNDQTAWKSSPVADLENWRSPVLLIHADDDRNVPFSETVWLARELQERDVPYELLVFPDDVHNFLLHRNWIAAFKATARFLEEKLGQNP